MPALPGCFTPTEILEAWDAGADIVKVFPATPLGPAFIKDVRGPLPQVKLMPTGGVTLDNAGDWIRAGAVAVGVGTALLDAQAIAAGDYRVLRANARADRRERSRRARARVMTAGRDVRRDHAAAQPAGIRAAAAVAASCRPPSAAARPTSRSASRSSGSRACYVTRLPANAIGDAAVRALRAEGVRTDRIVRGGDRVGIYFAETGASQRASTVIYDRAHSAISEMAPDAVDWDARLSGAAWFHVTGITPALGAERRPQATRARDRARRAPQARASAST